MIKAIALDPGKTTGIAIGYIPEDPTVGTEIALDYGQAEMTHHELFYFVETQKPQYVIYESFRYRRGMSGEGVDLYPVELIGVLQLINQLHNFPIFLVQEPVVQAKGKPGKEPPNFFTDDRIKQMNLWIPGKDHGRSAAKHLLYNMKFKRLSEFARGLPVVLADFPQFP